MKKLHCVLLVTFVLPVALFPVRVQAQDAVATERAPIEAFVELLGDRPGERVAALQAISEQWNVGDTGPMIESARFARDPRTLSAIMSVLSEKDWPNVF